TDVAGTYRMDVINCRSQFPIINSPVFPDVLPNALTCPLQVIVENSTQTVACGSTQGAISFQATDMFGNALLAGGEDFEIQFTPSDGVTFSLMDEGTGQYLVTYSIELAGEY